MTVEPATVADLDPTARRFVAARRDGRDAEAGEAYQHLLFEHGKALLAFLIARVGRSDAEDVAQDVWLKVWSDLPEVGDRLNHFRGWLFTVARNKVLDRYRKHVPELRTNEDLYERHVLASLLEQYENRDVLRHCLERLDAEAARLVSARLAGANYDELCQSLGITPAVGYKRYFRAAEQLKDCVQKKSQ